LRQPVRQEEFSRYPIGIGRLGFQEPTKMASAKGAMMEFGKRRAPLYEMTSILVKIPWRPIPKRHHRIKYTLKLDTYIKN